jgi:hypothetical protein
MPEPVEKSQNPQLKPRSIAVPREIRGVFIQAAIAGFAGFAVLGLCTAVAPAFLGKSLGVGNDAVVGLVVLGVFAASTAGQVLLEVIPRAAALLAGCAALVVGMAVFALALATSSLALLIAGIVIAGAGQGLSFRAGLTGVNSASPADKRGEVASSFFVVAYLAISAPVIGEGALAEVAGLKPAGLVFAGVVAALSAIAIALLAAERRRTRAESATA